MRGDDLEQPKVVVVELRHTLLGEHDHAHLMLIARHRRQQHRLLDGRRSGDLDRVLDQVGVVDPEHEAVDERAAGDALADVTG